MPHKKPPLAARPDRAHRGLDRRGRAGGGRGARRRRPSTEPAVHWAYVKPVRPAVPAVARRGVGPEPDRRLRPRPAREGGPRALARGLPRDARPPAQPRPRRACRRRPAEVDAFLADAQPGRVRDGGRPPARLAPLRRALGAALARPRALRRHERLREGPAPHGLEVPRLGHRRPQPRPVLPRLHDRADRRRHAARARRSSSGSRPASTATRSSTRRAGSTSRRRASRRSSTA